MSYILNYNLIPRNREDCESFFPVLAGFFQVTAISSRDHNQRYLSVITNAFEHISFPKNSNYGMLASPNFKELSKEISSGTL